MDEGSKLRTPATLPKNIRKREIELKQLRSKESMMLVSEIDPNYPYGPNYCMHPFRLKQYYKYNRMRKYVRVQIEDEREIFKFNYVFYFGCLGAIFGTYGFTRLLNRFVFKKLSKKLHDHVSNFPLFYFGVPASAAGSVAYGYLNVYFIKNYCEDFLEKYREEAVGNGFEDYKISEDKGEKTWSNYYYMFKM